MRQHRVRRARLWAVLVGLLLVVLWATPAFGHATPVATQPADGQLLQEPPQEVTVTFDQPVGLAPAGNQLLDAIGAAVPAQFSVVDTVLRIRPHGLLTDGTYIVAWRVVSQDTHPVSGGFTFSVGHRSSTVVPAPAAEQHREVTLARVLAESARYLGVLGLAGIVAMAALLAPPDVGLAGASGRSLRRGATAFALLGGAAAVLLVPIGALAESGRPLADIFGAGTWRYGLLSPLGVQAGLVLTGCAVAVVALRSGAALAAVLGAATAISSVVVVGHTRSFGPPWLVLTADLVHVTAAAVWFGGLVGLVLVLGARPRLPVLVRAAVVARFSGVAGVLVVLLVAAGLVLYWRIGHSWSGLLDTTYGRLVLLKAALLVPVLAMACVNRFRLLPRLRTRERDRAVDLLTSTMRVEAAVLALVLLTTGVLVTQGPPPPTPPVNAQPGQTLVLNVDSDHGATILVTPALRGVNTIHVAITDAHDDPATLTDEPALTIRLPEVGLGPFQRPLSRTAPGTWEATADFPLPGRWTITLAVPVSRFEQPVVSGTVQIP